jgi:hypothetical protein
MRGNARRKRDRKRREKKGLSLSLVVDGQEKTRKHLISEELKIQKTVRQEHKKYMKLRRQELREAKKNIRSNSHDVSRPSREDSLPPIPKPSKQTEVPVDTNLPTEYEIIDKMESVETVVVAEKGWKNWIFGKWM